MAKKTIDQLSEEVGELRERLTVLESFHKGDLELRKQEERDNAWRERKLQARREAKPKRDKLMTRFVQERIEKLQNAMCLEDQLYKVFDQWYAQEVKPTIDALPIEEAEAMQFSRDHFKAYLATFGIKPVLSKAPGQTGGYLGRGPRYVFQGLRVRSQWRTPEDMEPETMAERQARLEEEGMLTPIRD